MAARVHEEVPVVEDGPETDVTGLAWVDGDVLVPLTTLLGSQLLRVLRVSLDLVPQSIDLLLIVIEAVAEVLLHLTDLSVLWEQIKKVLHLEHIELPDNLEGLLHSDSLLVLHSIAGVVV